MLLTKEKVTAAVALALAALVLADLRAPRVEDVPPVPPEERARAYRTVSGPPALAPERTFASARDPFRPEDPWAPSTPADLAPPPAPPAPRALPVGPARTPGTPADRLLVTVEPRPLPPPQDEGAGPR